ncbi:MAG: nitrous oxide reductase accessory protein NosL [Thermodesulfovibrionales bacterium]
MRRFLDKTLIAAFLCILFLFSLWMSVFGEHREECAICGMWIDQYMSTRHVIILKDNTTTSFCSIACAARYLNENRQKVKNVKVADFLTDRLINAEKAYYLEGSDVPGVMSYISRIAFSTKTDAERFQRKHGGRLITFKQAVENQLKD